MSKLSSIQLAVVATAVRSNGLPAASVRANGKLMFNDAANGLIGYDGKKEDRLYFKIGKDADGVIYIVPAKKEEGNTMHAAKNNDSFQFNDIKTIEALGMLPNTRYTVAQLEEEGTVFFSLTLKSKAEKDAEDAANVAAHTPAKTEGEIKEAMNRTTAPLPTEKEAEKAKVKAAKAAAKADMKK